MSISFASFVSQLVVCMLTFVHAMLSYTYYLKLLLSNLQLLQIIINLYIISIFY